MTASRNVDYPIRVLFLCTGNSARSQIAEAVLRKKGGERFLVASAGTEPAKEVRPEAIEVLRGFGIEWTDRHPKGFDAILADHWDLVFTLGDRVKESCPALPSRPVSAHWGVPDPMEIQDPARRATAFSQTLQLLSWRIDLMLALRIEQLERLVLSERLRAIGQQTDSQPSNRLAREEVRRIAPELS